MPKNKTFSALKNLGKEKAQQGKWKEKKHQKERREMLIIQETLGCHSEEEWGLSGS